MIRRDNGIYSVELRTEQACGKLDCCCGVAQYGGNHTRGIFLEKGNAEGVSAGLVEGPMEGGASWL